MIEDKNFDLDGIEMIRQYLKDYKLKARPLCADSIEAVSSMGTEFQKYMLGQKTEAEFFSRGTELHRPVLQKRHRTDAFFGFEKTKNFFYKTY